MGNNHETKAFLHTSVLFAGIWSPKGGARLILKLAEARVVQLFACPQVLDEIEKVLRRKAPGALGSLALLLDRSGLTLVSAPRQETVKRASAWESHLGDAQVIAAAWEKDVDYFITLDRKHFIDNLDLRNASPFPIGAPGDFLAWLRARLA